MSTTTEYIAELKHCTAQLSETNRDLRNAEKQVWNAIEQRAYAMIDLFAAYDAAHHV